MISVLLIGLGFYLGWKARGHEQKIKAAVMFWKK